MILIVFYMLVQHQITPIKTGGEDEFKIYIPWFLIFFHTH